MNKLGLSIGAATALLAANASFAADPIYGVWVRDGHPTDKLEFYDCSGKLCAKGVLPMLDGSPPPVVLRSAAKTGPNSWKGDLFNPEDGKTYTGKISYEAPNQFTLTGCLMAFLCQSETWTRVSGPPKAKPESKAEAKDDGKADNVDKAAAAPKSGGESAKTLAPTKPGAESAKAAGSKPANADAPKTAKAAKPAAPKAAPAHAKPPEDEAN